MTSSEPSAGYELREGESWETVYNGQLGVVQHERGYRFSLEALILAHACREERGALCEVGTGSGVIALSLAHWGRCSSITAVEIQDAMARRAGAAFAKYPAPDGRPSPALVHADARVWARGAGRGWDVVVCNPPYFVVGEGAQAPVAERAIARHEVTLTLEAMVLVATRVLKPRGRLYVTYPAWRLVDVMWRMREAGVEPKWMRWIHNAPEQPAKTVLVKGVLGGASQVEVAAPLFLRRHAGDAGNARTVYASEMQTILAGAWA